MEKLYTEKQKLLMVILFILGKIKFRLHAIDAPINKTKMLKKY